MFNDDMVDYSRRQILLDGDVDDELARRCWIGLHQLPEGEVTIYLNSGGGDVNAGLFMYDTIAKYRGHVHIHVLNRAWSMASVILQAGDLRTAEPNATIMYHEGTSGHPDGPANDTRAAYELDLREGKRCDEIIFARLKLADPRFSKARFRNWVNRAEYLTVEKAVHFGLLD